MGDSRFKITIAGKNPQWVTGTQLNAMVADDPQKLIRILKGGESVYKNTDGDMVKEKLSAEQLRNRKALGEENILFSADDPKRQAFRRDELRRTNKALAEKYQWLTAIRNGVPLLQLAENAAVGTEDATKARQELISASPKTHMASQLGFFIAGGVTAGKLLRGTAFDGLIAAHRKTVLGKTAQLAGEDAIFSTYLYGNHILNNNTEFIAEDLAAEIGRGLLFVSPLIGSYAARNFVGKGLQAGIRFSERGAVGAAVSGGRTVSSMLSRSADLGVGIGLLKKGGMQQRKIFQRTAGMRVLSRVLRRKKATRRISKLDIIEEGIRKADNEIAELSTKYTPEWFSARGRTKNQRVAGVQRLRDLSGQAFENLDTVDFKNMAPGVRAVEKTTAKAAKHLDGLVNKLDNPADVVLGNINEGQYTFQAQAVFDHIHTAGYDNIAGHLENMVHLESGKTSMRPWIQARLEAKLGKAPGWQVVDTEIAKFLEDPTVWKGVTPGRGKIINEGIDRIAKSHDDLANISKNFTDRFEELTTTDVKNLEKIDGVISEIEEGYRQLADQGVLKPQVVESIKKQLRETRKTLVNGKEAAFDAARVNEARKAAAEAAEARGKVANEQLPKTPEEIAAFEKESALENGSMLVAMRDLVYARLNNLGVMKKTRDTSFGIIAVKESTTQEERNALYEEVQQALNSVAGNPQALAAKMEMLSRNIGLSNPDIAFNSQQKAASMTYYLATQLPKPDISYRGEGVPPPPARVNEFVDKLIAAYEPISVGIAAAEGRVTPGMIASLRNTNPAIYAEMVTVMAGELQALSPEQRRKAPRASLLGIETFVGGLNPANVGLSLVQQQSNYAQTQAQQQAIHGTGRTMRNPGPQDPGSDYTSTQRITGY